MGMGVRKPDLRVVIPPSGKGMMPPLVRVGNALTIALQSRDTPADTHGNETCVTVGQRCEIQGPESKSPSWYLTPVTWIC